MAVEELARLDDREHGIACAVVLLAKDAEHASRERVVADEPEGGPRRRSRERVVPDEPEVALRDPHAGLRKGHLQVLDKGAEEGPLAKKGAQLGRRDALAPRPGSEP